MYYLSWNKPLRQNIIFTFHPLFLPFDLFLLYPFQMIEQVFIAESANIGHFHKWINNLEKIQQSGTKHMPCLCGGFEYYLF